MASQDTYGAAAAAMDADTEPRHGPSVSTDTTARYSTAVAYKSAASTSHAAAAARNDPEPPPAYMRPELISGGNAAKSSMANHRQLRQGAVAPAPAGFHSAVAARPMTNVYKAFRVRGSSKTWRLLLESARQAREVIMR